MKRDIFKELYTLRSKDILSSEEYNRLQAYYEKEEKNEQQESSENSSKKFMKIIGIIGAILVWAGILLLISTNWDKMTDIFKTILLVSIMLAVYWTWIYLYYFKNYEKIWQAVIFLGALIYGANIFLIWQIYNAGWTYSEAFGLWTLWVLPLAYITWFWSLLSLWLVTLNIYVYSQIFDIFDINPADYFSLVTLILTMIYAGMMFISKKLFRNIYMFLFLIWVALTIISHTIILWNSYDSAVFNLLFLWFGWLTVTNLSKIFSSDDYKWLKIWLNSFWFLAMIFSTYLLIIHSFYDTNLETSTTIVPISLIITIIISLVSERSRFTRENKKSNEHAYYIIFVFLVLMTIWSLFKLWDVIYISSNIFFLFFVVYLVYSWTKHNNNMFVNIGILGFVAFVFTKYFDLFYDMMSGWLFFVAWWAILLTWWYFLERFRKNLINKKIVL